jgi:L-cysteine:1D-myo-inositol 2-amino-2-deoxy-alpha-D-glucopyranoside ligase
VHAWPAPHIPQIPGRGQALRLFDPALRRQATVSGPHRASLAVCGITPGVGTHVGHVATYVAFDLIIRAWLDQGLVVTTVQHITDVDAGSLAGMDDELATFALDMTALGVIPPDHLVDTAEMLPPAAAALARLLQTGAAERSPGNAAVDAGNHGEVSARLEEDPQLGRLSGMTIDDLLARARGQAAAGPEQGEVRPASGRHGLDGVLWRGALPIQAARARDIGAAGEGRDEASQPDQSDDATFGEAQESDGSDGAAGAPRGGAPAGGAPAGAVGGRVDAGRPSRDLTCAAAMLAHLDGSCDVLGGGADLLLHHEAAASHLRSLTGVERPVRRRVQTGTVTVGGVPMGRPGGTPVLVADLLERGVQPTAIRLAILGHHYRSDWDYSPRDLDEARARLQRWTAAVSGNGGPTAEPLLAEVRAALADDLDTPAALSAADRWADLALSYGQPGGLTEDDVVEGAPGVAARAVDALLGVRL